MHNLLHAIVYMSPKFLSSLYKQKTYKTPQIGEKHKTVSTLYTLSTAILVLLIYIRLSGLCMSSKGCLYQMLGNSFQAFLGYNTDENGTFMSLQKT